MEWSAGAGKSISEMTESAISPGEVWVGGTGKEGEIAIIPGLLGIGRPGKGPGFCEVCCSW